MATTHHQSSMQNTGIRTLLLTLVLLSILIAFYYRFMDNLVMIQVRAHRAVNGGCSGRRTTHLLTHFARLLRYIQAGQYIDSTIGVSLGLATMTAAAAGQVVSDVSGVVFGGTLERFLVRLSLIKSPSLTTAQRQLSICRNVSMAGAVVGVIFGCALGATTLLLVDLEARDRIERATRLREIVTDMISTDDQDGLHCETCTIFVESSSDFDFDKKGDDKWRTSMKFLGDEETHHVRDCAEKKEILLSSNRQIMCVPIVDDDTLIAVIEFRHNRDDSSGFTEQDLKTARVMARHLAIFMNRIVE